MIKEKPGLNWVKGCDALRVRFHPYEFPTCERKGVRNFFLLINEQQTGFTPSWQSNLAVFPKSSGFKVMKNI